MSNLTVFTEEQFLQSLKPVPEGFQLKPSTSLAAQMIGADDSKKKSQSDFYSHRRVRFGKKPYFEVYKAERKPGGGTDYVSEFVQEEAFGIYDLNKNQITHQWVAFQGIPVEIRGGGGHKSFNTKKEGDSGVRCQTVKAEFTNPLTGEVESVYGNNPLDFIPPGFADYENKNALNRQFVEKQIELYGKLDSKYSERIKGEAEQLQKAYGEFLAENGIEPYMVGSEILQNRFNEKLQELQDQIQSLADALQEEDSPSLKQEKAALEETLRTLKVKQNEYMTLLPLQQKLCFPEYAEAFTKLDRKCSECIKNGWNVSIDYKEGGNELVEDKCTSRGEMVFVVYRLAFKVQGQLRWLYPQELGIPTITGPFVIILEKMNSTDNRYRGDSDGAIKLKNPEKQPWIPDGAKPWKWFYKDVFSKYNGSLIGDSDDFGLGQSAYAPRTFFGVPTQIFLAEIRSTNSRDYTPLFYPAGDKEFMLQNGIRWGLDAVDVLNREKTEASDEPNPNALPAQTTVDVGATQVVDTTISPEVLERAKNFAPTASSSTVNKGAPKLDMGSTAATPSIFKSARDK